MSDRIIPTEAWDESHPDHNFYVNLTGRCYADHDHNATLA